MLSLFYFSYSWFKVLDLYFNCLQFSLACPSCFHCNSLLQALLQLLRKCFAITFDENINYQQVSDVFTDSSKFSWMFSESSNVGDCTVTSSHVTSLPSALNFSMPTVPFTYFFPMHCHFDTGLHYDSYLWSYATLWSTKL